MVLGGLWHGPNWTFVAWGALHGVALAAHHGWRTVRGNPKPSGRWWSTALARIVTAHYVVFCWIFFRATSFQNARDVLSRLASLSVSFANISMPIATVLLVAAAGHFTPKKWAGLIRVSSPARRSTRRPRRWRCWCWRLSTLR